MKRLLCALILPIILASGCGERGTAPLTRAVRQSDWAAPPTIVSAHQGRDGIVLLGKAAPEARVVLRGANGETFGVSADAEGAFEITVPRPPQDWLLRPEVQHGQEATSGPDRLLIPNDPTAPVVVLSPGAATRRLTGAGPLSAIDSDGRAMLASGLANGQGEVSVSVDGRSPVRTRPDSDGRWTLEIPLVGAGAIRVDSHEYSFPGMATPNSDSPLMARLDGGWRVIWRLDDGAAQTVWLPAG